MMHSAQLGAFYVRHGNHPTQKIANALDALGHHQLANEVAAYGLTEDDHALRVVVFGEFSVGKSTLINALLGRPLLAASLRPTTGVPTEVRSGADEVKIIFRDGRQRQISFDEAKTYSDLGVENRARDDVERIIISTQGGPLRQGIALIDTPGLLDKDRQTARARHEVAAADIVLLVLGAVKLLSQTERSFAIDWLTDELRKPVVPVVNRLGQTDPEGRAQLRAMLKQFTATLIQPFDKPWYEVDALPALRYRLDLPGWPSPIDDYEKLSAVLAGLSSNRIRRLKERSRNTWQLSWKRRARKENSEALEKLTKEADRAAYERIAQLRAIEATLGRIRGNVPGERARCVGYIDQYKTGQRFAVANNALPSVEHLKSEEQRKNATERAGLALERACEAIDRNANEILMGLAKDADVVLGPVSLRELAALNAPVDTHIEQKESEAAFGLGAIGVVLGGLASLALTGGLAAPFLLAGALAGAGLGRSIADTSNEVAEFRRKYCDDVDAHLDKLKPLLTAEFDARAKELTTALEARIEALKTLPPAGEELALRRELEALLH
jgi:predicted GTPase